MATVWSYSASITIAYKRWQSKDPPENERNVYSWMPKTTEMCEHHLDRQSDLSSASRLAMRQRWNLFSFMGLINDTDTFSNYSLLLQRTATGGSKVYILIFTIFIVKLSYVNFSLNEYSYKRIPYCCNSSYPCDISGDHCNIVHCNSKECCEVRQ